MLAYRFVDMPEMGHAPQPKYFFAENRVVASKELGGTMVCSFPVYRSLSFHSGSGICDS